MLPIDTCAITSIDKVKLKYNKMNKAIDESKGYRKITRKFSKQIKNKQNNKTITKGNF